MPHRTLSRAILSLMALFVVGCSGPFLLLPGGEPEGPVAPMPSSWTFVEEISTIEIETNPDDPYSVNVWAVGMDEHLYLHAGANRATWVEHLEADPRIRVRIEGVIYELAAARVRGESEFARFADAYQAKYRTRPRNENVSEVYLLRLGAR